MGIISHFDIMVQYSRGVYHVVITYLYTTNTHYM